MPELLRHADDALPSWPSNSDKVRPDSAVDTAVPLENPPPMARRAVGFPFSLIVRWISAALLVAVGVMRLGDLARGWSWFADRAIPCVFRNTWVPSVL